MNGKNPYESIVARQLDLRFVSVPETGWKRFFIRSTVMCACGHRTPRRAALALPDNVPLSGGTLVFDGARPEKCAECLAVKAKPGIVLCGSCKCAIIPGQQVCIGWGVPEHLDVATFVGGTPAVAGSNSSYLICVGCSDSILDLAGHWMGDGISTAGFETQRVDP